MSPGLLTETCRCPLCHEDLGPLQAGRLVCCGTCNTPYHRLCYWELGGCATLGCTNRQPRLTLRVQPATAQPLAIGSGPRMQQLAVVCLLSILVIATVLTWPILKQMSFGVEEALVQGAHKIKQEAALPKRERVRAGEACDCWGRHEVGCRHARDRPRFDLTAPVDDRLHVPR